MFLPVFLFLYFSLFLFPNHVFKTMFSWCATPSLSTQFPWNAFSFCYFPISLSSLMLLFFFSSLLEVSALCSQSLTKRNPECCRWCRDDRAPCAVTRQMPPSELISASPVSIEQCATALWCPVCSCLCLTRTWKKKQQYGVLLLSFFFFPLKNFKWSRFSQLRCLYLVTLRQSLSHSIRGKCREK